MTAASAPAGASAAKLHAALLEYFSAPGKYQLSLRQPALLFASIREILQIAAGRGQVEHLPQRRGDQLREAAGFFVRAALLYPGADHYAVFGLAPRANPVELKERYRLLMRLTHPDFAGEATADWSDDAATRVNRAYEILSSPVLRREYDEQLAPAPRAGRPAEPVKAEHGYAVQQPRRAEKRGWRVNRTAAWTLAAGLAMLLVFFLFPAQETGHLVQKTPPSPARSWAKNMAAERATSTAGTDLRPTELLAAAPVAAAVPAPAAPATPTAALAAAAAAAPLAAPSVPAPLTTATPRTTETAPPPAHAAPAPMTRQMPAPRPATPQAPSQAAHGPSAAELAALYRGSLAGSRVADPLPTPVAPRASEPAPAPVFPPAPAVAAAQPATAAPAMPVMAARAVSVGAAPPTLNDAQPLLTQMLHVLEAGSGDQLLRLLDAEGRQAPAAQALSRQYDQLVRGARPVRLSQVEFRSEARDGVLLVTGRIRLHAGEPTIGSHGERLLVRAEFVSRGGKVLLTGLSGAPD